MKRQHVESQKGEIEFRKKLVQQQIDGTEFFKDEYDAGGIEKILLERMAKTFEHINQLKQTIDVSPYIEIGAERCQRSLVMENEIGASGAAVDLSFDMLKSGEHYKTVFKKSKLPFRVCSDANNLPFRTGSLPFAFCYEFLHHFPEPAPVVAEIHRVLAPGGTFFFDEEPFKRVLHLNLYKSEKIYSRGSLNSNLLKKGLDYFFAQDVCNEVEHGIIENDSISFSEWKRALRIFEEKNVTLRSVRVINTELFNPKNVLKYAAAYLFGGNISGLCRKAGTYAKHEQSIFDMLICPTCLESGREARLDISESGPVCTECKRTYPVVDGVAFLLTYTKLEEVYPEIYSLLKK